MKTGHLPKRQLPGDKEDTHIAQVLGSCPISAKSNGRLGRLDDEFSPLDLAVAGAT